MNDIYEKFASPQNLRSAFSYIKKEIKKSSLPLDPFWVPGLSAIEKLDHAFFNSLSKELLEGKYKPGTACFLLQHKDNFGVRKIAMINMVDRIVYQALFNKDILGRQIEAKFELRNFYPKLSKLKSRYLQNYKKFYENFINNQEMSTVEGFKWRGEFDISAFYDNVDHSILFGRLETDLRGSEKLIELLETMLSKWATSGRGVPQGPDASSLISNYYLTSIDSTFRKLEMKGNIRYSRYMDDLIIQATSENNLYFGIEQLTEELNKLELNLNSKSDIEEVSIDWYKTLAFLDPYFEPEDDDIVFNVFEEIKHEIPELIKRLGDKEERKFVKRREISKLKYYLKADSSYEFVEEIILLYPYLPSLADLICKYILPIASNEKIRFLILKIIAEHHLFRWQEFWLAKVILLEDLRYTHPFGIDFRKNKEWEIRAISHFVGMLVKQGRLEVNEIQTAINSSENEYERNLYIGLLGNIKKTNNIKNFLKKELSNSSFEGKTIILSQTLTQSQINKIAKKANLFSFDVQKTNPISPHNVLGFIDQKLSQTLGFPLDISPSKEMVLEILSKNNSLVITGKLLDGKYINASNSQKSRLVKLIKCLCSEHSGKEKSSFNNFYFRELVAKYPELKTVDISNISLAREKADRLTPLLKENISLFLEINTYRAETCYKFRRAIDDVCFMLIPDKDKQSMATLAKNLIDTNSVKN